MNTLDENCKKLKSDLKRYLENNLDSVQCVTDVIGAMKDKSVNFEIKENIDIDDLYADLSRSQRTAQLILNLYTDFKIYKNCEIGKSLDKKSADPISKFYEKESRTEPDQSDVVDAIYNYVLCYLRVLFFEMHNINRNEIPEDLKCIMCDSVFSEGDVVCSTCEYPMSETIKNTPKSRHKEKIENLNNTIGNCELIESNNYQNQSICENCGGCKMIFDEILCGDCFSARYNDWICSYRKCGMTNIDSDRYCKSCGIERSSVLIADIPLWRCKNHIRDRILICGKCELINEIDKNVYCKCKGTSDRSSEALDNLRNDHRQNETNFSNGENNQSNIDRKNKCQCGTIKPQNQSICENCRNSPNDHSFPIFNGSWICGKCGATNQVTKDKLCCGCGVKKDKKVEIRNQNEFDGKQETIRVSDKVNNQSNIDQKSQWKCEHCEMINDVVFLSCRCCSWARAVIWTCSHCSKENEESVDQCEACGRTNENVEKKLCVRCRQKESIMNGLCAQCLSDRDLDWRCLYRNCGRINSFKDDYCKDCGLHRYFFWKHGAPNWMLKDGYPERIWICYSCWTINKWSDDRCTKYFVWCLAERDKFAKWCKSCGSQNRRSEIKCSRCKQSL